MNAAELLFASLQAWAQAQPEDDAELARRIGLAERTVWALRRDPGYRPTFATLSRLAGAAHGCRCAAPVAERRAP